MQIRVSSSEKGDAQVTIDGKQSPYVDAVILVNPSEDSSNLDVSIFCFKDNESVSSNIDEYITSVKNDPKIIPSELITKCNEQIIAILSKDGYGIKHIK